MSDYQPIIKSRGFNPAPIAGNIPFWADSINNPECVGRKDYTEFWEEQFYYIINGYHTGGLFIPPKYYELLNFGVIDGAGGGGFVRPYFIDLHYEIYMAEYEIRNDNSCSGMIFPKARRKALSFTEVQLIKYGMKYTQSYRAGVAAGLSTFTTSLRDKLYRTYNMCPPELMMQHLKRGEDAFILGYEEKTFNGYQKTQTQYCKFETMQDDSKKFEGEFFDDVFFEEVGEFELAEEALISILPALKEGKDFKGKVFLPGTGGSMLAGGKTFASIWNNADRYGLRKMFIPARRFYLPYLRRINGSSLTPHLDAQYPDLSPEQLLGCEDVQSAEIGLKEEALELSKLPNKSDFIQFKQNMPETIEDVFVSGGRNKFDSEMLYNQLHAISSLDSNKYVEYVLDWAKDKDGEYEQPLRVIERVADVKDKEWERIRVFQKPNQEYQNLDFGGCDTYNQDVSQATTSQGAICVLRRADKMVFAEENGIIPCCTYYARPPRKELHWDIALKISVWYNLVGRMMIAAEMDICIGYFKSNFGTRYLARRPKSFDVVGTKMTHEYGVKMTGQTKPKMISFMQTWVVDNIIFCWSDQLCRDLVAYDDEHIGNDWDLADALGLGLIAISDTKRNVTSKDDELTSNSSNDLIKWGVNSRGVVVADNMEEEMKKLFSRS